MENKKKSTVLKVALASAILLMLAACIAPVSAVDAFTSNNQTYVTVANDDHVRFNVTGNNTYYYNFSKAGGGLKAIHITNSTSDNDGSVYPIFPPTHNEVGGFIPRSWYSCTCASTISPTRSAFPGYSKHSMTSSLSNKPGNV